MASQRDYIAHYGVKGQKWGARRYQNDDGTLTAEGKARYHKNTANQIASLMDDAKKIETESNKAFKSARKQYKALGKNQLQRMAAVDDDNNEKARKYRETYEKAASLGEESYYRQLKASQLYKSLGKTSLSRMRAMKKNDPRRDEARKQLLNKKLWQNANARIVELDKERRQLAKMSRRGY